MSMQRIFFFLKHAVQELTDAVTNEYKWVEKSQLYLNISKTSQKDQILTMIPMFLCKCYESLNT